MKKAAGLFLILFLGYAWYQHFCPELLTRLYRTIGGEKEARPVDLPSLKMRRSNTWHELTSLRSNYPLFNDTNAFGRLWQAYMEAARSPQVYPYYRRAQDLADSRIRELLPGLLDYCAYLRTVDERVFQIKTNQAIADKQKAIAQVRTELSSFERQPDFARKQAAYSTAGLMLMGEPDIREAGEIWIGLAQDIVTNSFPEMRAADAQLQQWREKATALATQWCALNAQVESVQPRLNKEPPVLTAEQLEERLHPAWTKELNLPR